MRFGARHTLKCKPLVFHQSTLVLLWNRCYLCDNEVQYGSSTQLGQLVDYVRKQAHMNLRKPGELLEYWAEPTFLCATSVSDIGVKKIIIPNGRSQHKSQQ